MRKSNSQLILTPISAGFPNAAEDAPSVPLDLNDLVIRHPAATFFMRVSGDSMEGAGILDGDIVAVDKSLEVKSGDKIVAFIDGAFTLKKFVKNGDQGMLVPENPKYQPIPVDESNDFQIWGVVIAVVRTLN